MGKRRGRSIFGRGDSQKKIAREQRKMEKQMGLQGAMPPRGQGVPAQRLDPETARILRRAQEREEKGKQRAAEGIQLRVVGRPFHWVPQMTRRALNELCQTGTVKLGRCVYYLREHKPGENSAIFTVDHHTPAGRVFNAGIYRIDWAQTPATIEHLGRGQENRD